ncbi:hypothetical protein CROQUDRAFT_68206 [Cronartium quercuum f. sp. fusiforme G11]|uniref:PRELI/MSF1 domain-containing protein n=1 Tax=Cronartium quercuum f. sp. fusiforme G11 TaxID=708437 RepID=A0A9P6ND54_9BASI|nr:hypothetical protein CROQUDRAFT_68206 [Cronartium quercuum f. sp. fusiforme G11]
MVLHHTDQTVISYRFADVCQAHTLRYPNPFSPHVISSDIIERGWDSEGKIFKTSRLVLKRGTLPSWAPRGIVEKSETWVLEQSVLDVFGGEMVVCSRNLDHRIVMEVIERLSIRARGEVCDATTSVQVTSSWGFHLVRKRIEHYGVSRFQRQGKTARLGLDMTIQILQPNSSLREKLLDGERLNYPPVTPSSAVAARLQALRARAKANKQRISALLQRGNSDTEPQHGNEGMSKEEEAELKELETEYGLVSESSHESSSVDTPPSMRRWFWWWRWHLGQSPQPDQTSNVNLDSPRTHTNVSSAGRCS